jgi:transcriptional regulator
MHIPNKFKQDDQEQLDEFIQQYPFATLITFRGVNDADVNGSDVNDKVASDSGLEANHIPFMLTQSQLSESKGKAVLQGHIAKVNPLWKNVRDQSEVLVVFSGPNHYISPNHYPTKQETGKAVPTWNYSVVHVTGRMSYIHDKAWNLDMINRLTDQHEAGEPSPWSVADAPENYIQKMLAAIVGIEIEILSMTGQWKLSQNQPEKNQLGLISGLSQSTDVASQEMAGLIEKHADNIKNSEIGCR